MHPSQRTSYVAHMGCFTRSRAVRRGSGKAFTDTDLANRARGALRLAAARPEPRMGYHQQGLGWMPTHGTGEAERARGEREARGKRGAQN